MDDLLAQLDQLHQALQSADEESRPGIQQLINDIQELLGIGAAAAHASEEGQVPGQELPAEAEDEFLRFQAEIAALESSNQETSNSNSNDKSYNNKNGSPAAQNDVVQDQGNLDNLEAHDIGEELKALEGMKCFAPFQATWGQIGYYSGIVLCVDNQGGHEESNGDIRVRIVFTQPIVERMRPCDFFMEGRCRFSDDECKFSHGEVVSLSELREYRDPDYSKVIPGAKILAKYSDGLWYKAEVTKITAAGECEVAYHSYKNQLFTIPIHETCPTAETDGESDSSSDDERGSPNSLSDTEANDDETASVTFIRVSAATPLGDWEKHTRGIGSKLMAKMGYILGTGLGKNAEGRINPVDAVVLPPGRSLDRCMELKEKAGSSGANLFSVERRLKRQKQKEAQRAKTEEKKQAETQSVFNFLNSINIRKSKSHNQAKHNGKNSSTRNYNKESCKDLSKNLLTIGTSIKAVEKDIVKCKESIKRHEGRDKATVDKLKEKLNVLEYQLSKFRNNETQIAKEQSNRSAKKKLEIF